MTTTDRIEKQVVLRAPRARVWRAIANADEFGAWFRMKLDGAFAEGATVRGRITHPGYEHLTVEMLVERIEPERYFAYRWHPYAIDPGVDYSSEPTTLVEFRLDEAAGGTRLTNRRVGLRSHPACAPCRGVPDERPGVDRTGGEPRAPCRAPVGLRRRG